MQERSVDGNSSLSCTFEQRLVSGPLRMFVSGSSGEVRGSAPPPPLVQEDRHCRWCPDGQVHVGPEAAGLVWS